MDPVFLTDERVIAARLESDPIDAPIRLFDLEGLGIDRAGFLDALGPSFAQLAWDLYDVRRTQVAFLRERLPGAGAALDGFYPAFFAGRCSLGDLGGPLAQLSPADRAHVHEVKPCRRRSIARFRVAGRDIGRQPVTGFVQDTGDFRTMTRIFQPMDDEVCAARPFLDLLQRVTDMVRCVDPGARVLELTVHQMSQVVHRDVFSDNSPEGIHQDGVDYVVPALVVERRHVQGGESRVFAEDRRTCLYHVTLGQGQGLFHADRGSRLWHDVTPVVLDEACSSGEGVRNLFGFDVNVLER